MKLLKGLLPSLALLAFNSASCSSFFLSESGDQFDVDAQIEDQKVLTSNANNDASTAGYTKTFNVVWKRGEEILRVDTNVPTGSTPVFTGNPSYSDDTYQYKFLEWNPKPTPIRRDMTFTAVYKAVSKIFVFNPITNTKGDVVAYSVGGFINKDIPVVDIPSTYNGIPVTKIENDAFKNKTSITAVNIPNTIKEIPENAFCGCVNLKSLNLSEGVETINKYSFSSCINLRSVKFPSTLKNIEFGAFLQTNLNEINLPDSIEKIDTFAFVNQSDPIRRLRLPNNSVIISSDAFLSKKIASISLPKDFYTRCEYSKDVKYNMFCAGTKISYINYAGSISEYESKINNKIKIYTDGDYKIFSKANVIENSYEDKETFENNSNKKIIVWKDYNDTITHFTYSDGIDNYPEVGQVPTRAKDSSYQYTFNKWDVTTDSELNVEERKATYTAETRKYDLVFKLANGKTITKELSYNEEVTFPNDIEDTDDSYFLGWDKDVFTKMPAEDITINALYSRKDAVGLSYITDNKTVGFQSFDSLVNNNRIKVTDNGKTVTNEISSSKTERFNEGGNLVFPNYITKIGYFSLTNLKNIGIPEGVTYIQSLSSNSNISKINLPTTLTSMGNACFAASFGVKEIDFSNTNIESLPSNVFKNNAVIEKIVFGNKIKNFGSDICNNCKNLKEVVFGSGATETGVSMLRSCPSLEKITWGSIKSINEGTFAENDFASFTIPNQITKIGRNAFYLCSKLESITFSSNIDTIGANVFMCCNKLTTVEIPNGVSRIEDYTFASSGIQTVIVPTSVSYINFGAFSFNSQTINICYKGSSTQWSSITKDGTLPNNCKVTYNYR